MSEDVELVEDVLKIEFSQEEFEIKPFGDGASHETFSAESESYSLIVKLCDNDWSGLPSFEKGFQIEAPVLQKVQQKSEIPVPKVYAYDNSKSEFEVEYIVMERIEGSSMYEHFNHPENNQNIKRYGELLAELHNSFQFNDSGGLKETNDELKVEPQSWSSMFEEMIWKLTSHLEKIEAYDFRDRVRELVKENKALLKSRESTLVHQEFSPRNLIGDDRDINAVIDWERSISGDPELDLAISEKHLLQKEDGTLETRENSEEIRKMFYEAYKSKRELSSNYSLRKNLYFLPYITLMAYITSDREQNKIKPEAEKQLKQVETALN